MISLCFFLISGLAFACAYQNTNFRKRIVVLEQAADMLADNQNGALDMLQQHKARIASLENALLVVARETANMSTGHSRRLYALEAEHPKGPFRG